jgi:hypothetical protein
MQVAHGLYGHRPMKMLQLQLWDESRGEAHAISHYPIRGSGPPSTSRRSIALTPLLTERISAYRRSSSTHAMLQMATNATGMISFYTTYCPEKICILLVRACSSFITVTSGHGIFLKLFYRRCFKMCL